MKETSRIPIIRLKGNLVISIQVAMSDRMVQLLKDDVTQRIEQERPAGLAIDVSGIDIMDSYISRAIHDLCIVASLMGVPTAISGIDPMIALTLVEMGVSLEGVHTHRDLESALEFLDGQHPITDEDPLSLEISGGLETEEDELIRFLEEDTTDRDEIVVDETNQFQ
ncbi:MAG: STAS domain-containing protein [Acidobacteria bacterium]|nr:MAG: STAS domain-containing protein [Acidobacteriota bacterium]